MTWGAAKWGSGDTTSDAINSIPFTFYKVIDGAITPDTTITPAVQYNRTIENSFTALSDMTIMRLYDGTLLWNTVFTGNTTNADSSTSASWSDNTSTTLSYTCGTVTTPSWSSL
jgi:hypothetical protein